MKTQYVTVWKFCGLKVQRRRIGNWQAPRSRLFKVWRQHGWLYVDVLRWRFEVIR